MTVDAHSECPVCKNDISDVPYSNKRWEGYVLNKYFLPYFFKKCWLALLLTLYIVGKIIFFGVEFNYYFVINIILSLYLYFDLLFERMFIEIATWKYNESYLEGTVLIGRIAMCALVVILSFVW